VVVPRHPHHVTRRGCRRRQTFSDSDDCRDYLDPLQGKKTQSGVSIRPYRLTPNHVRRVVVPETKKRLAPNRRTELFPIQ
jgi:putative transposase